MARPTIDRAISVLIQGDDPLTSTVIWAPLAATAIEERLSRVPAVAPVFVRKSDAFLEALDDAEILVMPGGQELYTPEVAEGIRTRGTGVKWIQLITAGHDGVEAHGAPEGVPVTRSGGHSAPIAAEHVIAMLLALVRRIPVMLENQKERRWDRGIWDSLESIEGRTMAVVGFGYIGKAVAERARSFGMKVVVVNRTGAAEEMADESRSIDALDKALADADVVVLSLPLTEATNRLFDAATIAKCKPGAILINTGRGAVADTDAVAAALKKGHLGGAGLDVVDPEPLPPESPLWDAPNLILSPHVAVVGSTLSNARVAETVVGNIERYLSGEPLLHRLL